MAIIANPWKLGKDPTPAQRNQYRVAAGGFSVYALADMAKRIRRDELMTLMLTAHDRDLILDRTLIDGRSRERIESALTAGPHKIMVRLTPDDLNDLLEWIASAANHAEEPSLKKELDALYDRVQCVEDSLDVYEA